MPWSSSPPGPIARPARVALGRAVRQLRREQGLTQMQLEDRSGFDQVISRLERGIDVKLRTSRLIELLDALGVDRIVLHSRFDDVTWAGFTRRLLRVDEGE